LFHVENISVYFRLLSVCSYTCLVCGQTGTFYCVISHTVRNLLLPCDASAEHGYEIACRPSVCPSVRLSV